MSKFRSLSSGSLGLMHILDLNVQSRKSTIFMFIQMMLLSISYYCRILGHTCFCCNRTKLKCDKVVLKFYQTENFLTGMRTLGSFLSSRALMDSAYYLLYKFRVQLIKFNKFHDSGRRVKFIYFSGFQSENFYQCTKNPKSTPAPRHQLQWFLVDTR